MNYFLVSNHFETRLQNIEEKLVPGTSTHDFSKKVFSKYILLTLHITLKLNMY